MSGEDNKRLVARAVAGVINGGDLDAVGELYAPNIAAAAREWTAPFRAAPPACLSATCARSTGSPSAAAASSTGGL